MDYVNTNFATRDATIATKAATSSLTSELATRDTAIATKAATSYVNSELATRDARLDDVERVVTVEPNVTFNYLETGTDALVIRGPNEVSAKFRGPPAGDLEGRVVFYKDLLLNGG